MKNIFIALCMVLFTWLPVAAQGAIGSWQNYQSYHNATALAVAGSNVYTVGNGGLYVYDNDDSSVRCLYKSAPLSDTDISSIYYNATTKSVLVIYSDYNIDILTAGDEVLNMPEYMNKNMTQDKTVNDVYIYNEYAYLCTKFGIVVINMAHQEVTNSYILNRNVNSCVIHDGIIAAATPDGLLTAKITDNLLDVNNWKMISTDVYVYLSERNDKVIGSLSGNGVGVINISEYGFQQLISGTYKYIKVFTDVMLVGNSEVIAIFDTDTHFYYLQHNLNVQDICYDNGTYWMARGDYGLSAYTYNSDENRFEQKIDGIIPNSPIRNLAYTMSVANGKLLVTGGGIESNRFNRKGTIMIMQNGVWTNFQEDGIYEQTGLTYRDITGVVQDPLDSNHHFATSAGEGVYEFRNGEFVNLYSLSNSTLESALKGRTTYVRTNSAVYDKNGNLWVSCSGPDPVNNLHVLSPDGKWTALQYSELMDKTSLGKAIFDSSGRLWIVSEWQVDNGLFCLDPNGTPTNSSDDKHRFIESLTNQDGTELTHQGVFCVAEDNDGAIWIGTGQGPLVISNPSYFFNDGFTCTQVKVPRNDGTNLADYLLSNDRINDIAVDGANRKWIATNANGVYLLSSDGLETVEHFTADNSPLPSDCVTSLAIDNSNGTVYIGTVNGIVSYQSDATEGAESLEKDAVYAFPNPVRPDYDGLITVCGLMDGCDVKITNVRGAVVYSGTSNGGLFTWNGCNLSGSRVASGVYFVMATDSEGNNGIVCKILMIK